MPDKPLVWMHGEVKTPPLSSAARIEAGGLLRILYHVAAEAIVILDLFAKKTRTTPKQAIEAAKRRLRLYQAAVS